jgi:MFS superfamily sulfate permease-like transporter
MLAFLAASATKPTVWEKIQAVPTETWIGLLIFVGVLLLMIRVWKILADFNDFAPWIVLVLVGGSVVAYVAYERSEPKVLSPVFDKLREVLPAKIEYKEAPMP